MTTDATLRLLKAQPLLSGFDEKQMAYIKQISEEILLEPGDYVVAEGEKSKDIFFILSGTCEVIKKSTSGENFVIDEMKEGMVFGEISFIDDQPRSSSIRAKTPCVLIKIPGTPNKIKNRWSIINKLNRKIYESTYDLLSENIIKECFTRLRKTNQKYILAIKKQIKDIELQNDYGFFFICMMTFFSFYSLIINQLTPQNIFNNASLLLLTSAILAIPVFIFIKKRNIFPPSVGLTLKNSLKSLLESFIIAFIAILTIGSFYYYITNQTEALKLSLIAGIQRLFHPLSIAILIYTFCIEFVLRGVTLSSLKRFLDDERGLKSVFLGAFFLSPLNLQEGFDIFIFQLYIDLALGFIYLRQKSLFGVTLLHFLIVQFFKFYH